MIAKLSSLAVENEFGLLLCPPAAKIMKLKEKLEKQAGAELCQAQDKFSRNVLN